jgi:hypothetical protein
MSDHETVAHAVNLLDQSVSQLVGPRHDYIASRYVTRASRYQELRDSLAGQQGAHGGHARSMPTIWIDAEMVLIELDRTVAGWAHGQGTADRLTRLCEANWRPQDLGLIAAYTKACLSWAAHIDELLDPKRVWTLDDPCPACERAWIYRKDSAGESVRSRALTVTVERATCRGCNESWPSMFLIRMLRAEAMEGLGA